ncbi:thymidylate synthase, partial [Aerococcus urinae]|uniref:thymidylate synthase n=3 Tax=Aerococcaceae TaxID=186827 RepID=UPI00254C9C50
FGDVHIYNNHFDQVKEQLSRQPGQLPQLEIKSDKSMFDLEKDDIVLNNYHPQAPIKASVAV